MKWVALAFFVGATIGIVYGGVRMIQPEISYGEGALEGTVVGEVRKTAGGNIRFDVDTPQVAGHVRVFSPQGARPTPGDTVAIAGTLKRPEPFDDFNYPRYLAGQGVYATMWVYNVEHTPAKNPSFGGVLFSIRERAHGVLVRILHGPAQEIAGAMALGYGSLLSQDVGDVLSRAGIRHITAISGLHIMLIIGMLISIAVRAGRSRRTGIIGALVFILFFIALVGAPSSAVRAGIMGGILFAGQIGGRPLNALRLLLYAATAMLIWNPHLLFSDIGFQLSFSAMLGIILLAGPIADRFATIPWASVRSVGSMTIAATLFTLPLTLFHFGIGSLGGIVMNILFLPMIGPLLALIFLSLLVGMGSVYLATLLVLPVRIVLEFMYGAAEITAKIPVSAIAVEEGSIALLFGGYAMMGVASWYILSRKRKLLRPVYEA